MTSSTLKRRSAAQAAKRRPHYTKADVKRIRLWLNGDRGWSQERFAYELGKLCGMRHGFSLSYEKLLEQGKRQVTPKIAIALAHLEHDEAHYYQEIRDDNKQTLESLVRGIELRVDELTSDMRKRLGKILKHS